jgi:hypothetical protein
VRVETGIYLEFSIISHARNLKAFKKQLSKLHDSFQDPYDLTKFSTWEGHIWTFSPDVMLETCRAGMHVRANKPAFKLFGKLTANYLTFSAAWRKTLYLSAKVTNSTHKSYFSAFRMAAEWFLPDLWEESQQDAVEMLFKRAFKDFQISCEEMETCLLIRLQLLSYSAVTSVMAAMAYFGSMVSPLSFNDRWPGVAKALLKIGRQLDKSLRGAPSLDWSTIRYLFKMAAEFNWTCGPRSYRPEDIQDFFRIAFAACARSGTAFKMIQRKLKHLKVTDEGDVIYIDVPDTKRKAGKIASLQLIACPGESHCPCAAFRRLRKNAGPVYISAANGSPLTARDMSTMMTLFRETLSEVVWHDRERITFHVFRISYIGYCACELGLELRETQLKSRHANIDGCLKKVYVAKAEDRLVHAQLDKLKTLIQSRMQDK